LIFWWPEAAWHVRRWTSSFKSSHGKKVHPKSSRAKKSLLRQVRPKARLHAKRKEKKVRIGQRKVRKEWESTITTKSQKENTEKWFRNERLIKAFTCFITNNNKNNAKSPTPSIPLHLCVLPRWAARTQGAVESSSGLQASLDLFLDHEQHWSMLIQSMQKIRVALYCVSLSNCALTHIFERINANSCWKSSSSLFNHSRMTVKEHAWARDLKQGAESSS
jgi:hypothetical protein